MSERDSSARSQTHRLASAQTRTHKLTKLPLDRPSPTRPVCRLTSSRSSATIGRTLARPPNHMDPPPSPPPPPWTHSHSPFRQHKTRDKHEIDRMTMTMVSVRMIGCASACERCTRFVRAPQHWPTQASESSASRAQCVGGNVMAARGKAKQRAALKCGPAPPLPS